MFNPSAYQAHQLQGAVQRCTRYRKRILDISQKVSALHIAPSFSAIEIVDLAYNILRVNPACEIGGDLFLMSKGHGCMSLYVVLEDLGVLSKKDIDAYCTPGGRLGAHPDYGNPGIVSSTGSLGHGLGIAVGMAYGERLQGRKGIVYVLLSDGECQAGSTWVALMMAANLRLHNLVIMIDNNDFSGLERMSEGHPSFYPLKEKFEAFGCESCIVDGHDSGALLTAVNMRQEEKPYVMVCRTTKGKGVSFMENEPIWHYRSPTADEYKKALNELSSTQ